MRQLRRGGSKGTGAQAPDAPGAVGTLEGPPETAQPGDPRSRRRYDPAWDDWKRPRRWPGVLLTFLIVLAFLGAVIWHYRPHTHTHKPRVQFSKIHPQHAFVPVLTSADSQIKSFQGAANRTGMTFTSLGDLVILHASCKCTYNFVITVTDASGDVVALPVNTTGNYDGTFNITQPAGQYTVTVVGSGPWVINVLQPGAAVPPLATPFNYYSSDESVVGPFTAADRYLSFKFLSLTNGHVYVHVLNHAGVKIATPFYAHVFLVKSAMLLGLPSPYYLEIDSSGFWNVSVKRTNTG